ncbi:MAG: phosphatase PAP2 family protein [Myxococcota bacterium]
MSLVPLWRSLAATLTAFSLVLGAAAARADEFPDGVRDTLGPRFEAARDGETRIARPRHDRRLDVVRRWNRIAIDASGLDHTPVAVGENRVFGEQIGPGRSSRAIAIVQIAVFEAVNAIHGGYRSYAGVRRAPLDTSLEAAVAQAAHDTLSALFPSQRASFDQNLADQLASLRVREARVLRGIALGRRAALAILEMRADDGSRHPEPRMGQDFLPSDAPGWWRQDPIGQAPLALGAHWAGVEPFVLRSADQFRVPPPPDMTSAAYTAAFDEVKALGGDGITTPTVRNADQTRTGTYWAYDGTPSLCAPPRLYNQIAVVIADQQRTGPVALARLLALANVAMADAGIAIWESKYHYQFWRPVTGIREAAPDTGPSGGGDRNPDTVGDPTFSPLGAPASNLTGPNFTPPFPAYPSGHAGFGGALFQMLRDFYGTDRIAFSFVSDEFNGTTLANDGSVRPLLPRSFRALSQAEEENGQSRIYLGIHWSFDKTEGIVQGRRIARYVFRNAFTPAGR